MVAALCPPRSWCSACVFVLLPADVRATAAAARLPQRTTSARRWRAAGLVNRCPLPLGRPVVRVQSGTADRWVRLPTLAGHGTRTEQLLGAGAAPRRDHRRPGRSTAGPTRSGCSSRVVWAEAVGAAGPAGDDRPGTPAHRPAARPRGVPSDQVSMSDLAFHALREYVPGDDLRHVHWRSSARAGQLLVRQYHDTRRTHATLLVDTRRDAYAESDFELALSVAASLTTRLPVTATTSRSSAASHVGGPRPDARRTCSTPSAVADFDDSTAGCRPARQRAARRPRHQLALPRHRHRPRRREVQRVLRLLPADLWAGVFRCGGPRERARRVRRPPDPDPVRPGAAPRRDGRGGPMSGESAPRPRSPRLGADDGGARWLVAIVRRVLGWWSGRGRRRGARRRRGGALPRAAAPRWACVTLPLAYVGPAHHTGLAFGDDGLPARPPSRRSSRHLRCWRLLVGTHPAGRGSGRGAAGAAPRGVRRGRRPRLLALSRSPTRSGRCCPCSACSPGPGDREPPRSPRSSLVFGTFCADRLSWWFERAGTSRPPDPRPGRRRWALALPVLVVRTLLAVPLGGRPLGDSQRSPGAARAGGGVRRGPGRPPLDGFRRFRKQPGDQPDNAWRELLRTAHPGPRPARCCGSLCSTATTGALARRQRRRPGQSRRPVPAVLGRPDLTAPAADKRRCRSTSRGPGTASGCRSSVVWSASTPTSRAASPGRCSASTRSRRTAMATRTLGGETLRVLRRPVDTTLPRGARPSRRSTRRLRRRRLPRQWARAVPAEPTTGSTRYCGPRR